jgi:hypothetical protein
MKPKAGRGARVWAGVTLLGVVAFVWLAFRVRLPQPPATRTVPPNASVGLVDQVAIQGTTLRDPTPLFLPTSFNSSRKDYVPAEPAGDFSGFSADLTFDVAELRLPLPPAATVPASPAEALVGDPPGEPFLGFGRTDVVVQPVAPRGAYVEISEEGTGKSVFGGPVLDAHPPTSAPWKPMEFMAAVDASGLVGPLVLTVHSDVAEVDAYFGRYLVERLRIGQRLLPGFYRVTVGP